MTLFDLPEFKHPVADDSIPEEFTTTWTQSPVVAPQYPDVLESYSPESVYIMTKVLSCREMLIDGEEDALLDPLGLRGMQRAATRLADAIMNKETILIHGDYDVDGTTGTSLLWWFLVACNSATPPHAWIPDRRADGYGMSEGSYDETQRTAAKVMITVDCGIVDGGMAERIETELGCDVIVTDHHLAGDELPQATAVINPNQPEDTYENKGLCGCGVAYKLAQATADILADRDPTMGERAQTTIKRLLPFVAIATIADVVPLTAENRHIVRKGLAHAVQTPSRGLTALLTTTLGAGVQPSPMDIGWKIGPLLNAKGRLEHALANVDLLTSTKSNEIHQGIAQMQSTNDERKKITTKATDEAIRLVKNLPDCHERRSYVVYLPDANEGVVGIVAGRIAEKTGRPAIVFAPSDQEGILKGSMRSIPGIHCRQVIDEIRHVIIKGGGHAAAAGLSCTMNLLPHVVTAVESAVQAQHPKMITGPKKTYDVTVNNADITSDLWEAIDACGPWGNGFERPILRIRRVDLDHKGLAPHGRSQKMLKGVAILGDGSRAEVLMMNATERQRHQLAGRTTLHHVQARCTINVFRGKRTKQLELLGADEMS